VPSPQPMNPPADVGDGPSARKTPVEWVEIEALTRRGQSTCGPPATRTPSRNSLVRRESVHDDAVALGGEPRANVAKLGETRMAVDKTTSISGPAVSLLPSYIRGNEEDAATPYM
jgi:hypothetical protein